MKNYIKIIIAFALVLCVIASTGAMFGVFADPLEGITVASGSQNLLSNGGFEYSDSVAAVDTVTENTYLTNGWVVGNALNTSFAISTDAKSGKKSLSATLSSGAHFALRNENVSSNGIISGLESGVYSLSLYAKGSGIIEIKYKDAAVDSVTTNQLSLTSDWQILSVDVMVVGASGKIQFEICSAGDSGTVFIDDVSFTKYTGLQNGDFESATGYTVPQALYDFGSNTTYNYIDDGNVLTNAGFEDSATVTNTSGKSWKDATIVKGWTSSYTHKNFVYSITDDTHSGKYSLRIDMNPTTGNNDDTRLHPDKDLITDTEPKGKITGLEPSTTYIVSYWVKGSAKSRVYAKKLTDLGEQNGDIKDSWITLTDDWQMITEEVQTNALGQAWWNINVSRIENADSYIIIDDVSMLTKAQATANVESMIDALNLKSSYAIQAKSDIENWATLLGKYNISNYSKYDEMVNGKTNSGTASTPEQDNTEDEYTYLSLNNVLVNSGFENSNTATNTSGKKWNNAIITDGWTTNYSASAKFNYSISNDSHSGKNSLKLSMASGTDDTRIHASKDLITDTALEGIMTGLTASQIYIVSYWIKGSASSRIYGKTVTDNSTDGGNLRDDYISATNEWTLITKEIPSNTLGQAWWNINVKQIAEGTSEVYIDDVLMQTKAQAIANIEAMINALDTDKSYSKQAISDIEQWVAALGSANISNYDLFVAKKSVNANNIHNNSGFETSNSANNTSGSWKSFTDGWMTSDEIKTANTSLEISNDAHSGRNSLKLTGIIDKEYRIFNTIANSANSTLAGITEGLAADTTYLVSYWVKGSATSRVYAKTYSSSVWNNEWGVKLDNPGNTWKLYTKEIKTNSYGEAWYNVYVYMNAATEIYLDDIALQTKEQAIANVEDMITAFDPSEKNALQKSADIEQWVNALGNSNISNYNLFVEKSSQIVNMGFELSDSASLKKGDYTNFTTGWKTNYVATNPPYSVEIANDAFIGNNALKVNVNSVDAGSGFRAMLGSVNSDKTDTVFDGLLSGYTPNTDYVVSYWVKGTANTKVFGKTNSGTSWDNNWQNPAHISLSDMWSLSCHTIKSDASGNAWWTLFVCGDVANTYAIIDDVSFIPKSEAIASVEAMIDAFDYTKATDNDVYIINQWMSVVTVSDDAKNSFNAKLADYKALKAELAWKTIDGVYGWETNLEGKITLDTSTVAYGKQSLKIDASQAVALRPTQIPFGMQNGYYTLVLYVKGGGKLSLTAMADNGKDKYELLNEEINITSGWDRYVISNIDIKENYSIDSLKLTFSDSSSIYLDAVQMYRQIGPGSYLDDITDNISDNALVLSGSPDGYFTEIYKTSDSNVLAKTGEITVPKYNSDIEYRFKITNINDSTDYAISDIRILSVNGTDGAAPVDEGAQKTLKTITDDATKVSVTAKMSDDARLTVKVLDENSAYYDLLLNYNYECIAHYNIFTIPQSAYEGDRTFTFTVGEEYNGKTLTVTRYDKDTRAIEEYEVKVTGGKISVTTPNDGAFMIQKPIEKQKAPIKETFVEKTEDKKEEFSDKKESDKKKDSVKNDYKKPSKQVIVKQKNNNKLIWTIIIIGLGLLLLMLIFTIIVIILRKRKQEEEETPEPSPNDTEQM